MILSLFPRMFAAILFIFTATETYAQSKGLSVEVQRIKQSQGQLHYQLFACPNSEEASWDKLKPLVTEQVEISKDNLILSFPMLESGQYVIRVFQDINDNALLDFSGSGVPKEPTGFSNNPNLLLGYPKPIDSCFLYDASNSVSHSANHSANHLVIIKLNNKKKRKRRKVR